MMIPKLGMCLPTIEDGRYIGSIQAAGNHEQVSLFLNASFFEGRYVGQGKLLILERKYAEILIAQIKAALETCSSS